MEENNQSTTLLVDASESVGSEEAAGLFILPNMTVGIDIPSQYMQNESLVLPPHVQRIFELGLCITSTDKEDQKRFWSLVAEIAAKRMKEQPLHSNV